MLAATIAVFAPIRKYELTNWDDDRYVTRNPYIRSLEPASLRAMFSTSAIVANYHPLTLVSLALNYRMSGTDSAAYHVTNLGLHVLNTLLVFVFFLMLSGGRAEVGLIVALFFGIHPMHVESVAWVSERKDVLYTFFFLLSLISYLGMLRPAASRSTKMALYALTVMFFAASLLSKPAAVVLPVVLVLIDYYCDRSVGKRMILEKLPLFAMSLLIGIVTIHAQSTAISSPPLTVLQRVMIGSNGLVTYLLKLLAPVQLSAFYPYPAYPAGGEIELPLRYALAPFAVLGISGLAAWSARFSRVGVFGALFFAVTLALVLQFVPVGGAVIADRYTYLPYLGPLFVVAACYSFVHRQQGSAWAWSKALFACGLVGYAAVLSVAARERCKVWTNSFTLWSDVLEQYPDSVPLAYYHRANALRDADRYEEALADYDHAIAIQPRYADAYVNRSNIYARLGRHRDAVAGYDRALEIDPGHVKAYANRGNARDALGEHRGALADFAKAIELDPRDPDTYLDRAQVYLNDGRSEEELADLDRYLALETDNAEAYYARGAARQLLRRYEASLADFDAAIRLRPRDPRFFLRRSVSFEGLRQWAKALEDARTAAGLGEPMPREYIDRLERSVASGVDDEPIAALRRSVAEHPEDRSAARELASALIERGRLDDANTVLRSSIDRWPCEKNLRTALANLSLRREGRAAQVAVLDDFVSRCPPPPDIVNDLAFLLAVAHEPEVRNPPKALALAKRAVGAFGEHPLVLDTLAVAYAANDQFDEALATSRRALAEGERSGLSEPDLATLRKHHATIEARSAIRE